MSRGIDIGHIRAARVSLDRSLNDAIGLSSVATNAARVFGECSEAFNAAKIAGAMANEVGTNIDMPCPCICELWKGHLE